MRHLKKRLSILEAATSTASGKWCRIIQQLGQSKDEAIAGHEAEHGPVGDASIILRVIV